MRAKQPEVKEKRLKLFVYGPAGVGKTWAAIQFPNAVIIDTEKGTDFYGEAIKSQGSVVLQSTNPDEIRDEIKELMTTNHGYKTLIIDPMTQIYNAVQEKWMRIFVKYAKDAKDAETQDPGMRFWGKVKSEMKALQRMILSLDMNVIVTSHQKDVYGDGFKKLGVTFDSMRGDDYLFDLIFQITKKGDKRIATTIKERAEVGKNKFPEEFEWSYSNFCQFYGKDILEREAKPVTMATPEQAERLRKLVDILKVEDAVVQKWLDKAEAESFEEMNAEQIGKCIKYLEDQIDSLKAPEPATPQIAVAPEEKETKSKKEKVAA